VYMVQMLNLGKKLLMKFVFIQLMQELDITVGVNMHFPWKLGNIIGSLFLTEGCMMLFETARIALGEC